jgi:spermidine synthase
MAVKGRMGDEETVAQNGTANAPDGDAAPPDWRQRSIWVLLSFVPAALLTAFTTHIATDVASAPLIWVVPLALYLLTFVIVFRERSLIPERVLLVLHLVAVVLALLHLSQIKHETWYLAAAVGTLAFFTSGLVAHRTLYEARPAARFLTSFYLFMSFGGALGGIFASLVAPNLFSEVVEYPLLLALTFACRPGALEGLSGRRDAGRLAAILVAAAAAIFALPALFQKAGVTFGQWGTTAVLAVALAVAIVALWRRPAEQLATALMLFLAVAVLPSSVHRGKAERSFFGVYRVVLSEDGDYNVLQHGTTLHGAQRIRDEKGNQAVDTTPCTYYHPRGPMAQAVGMSRLRLAAAERKGRFGVVGLGAGALACHSDASEAWRFYEIDPVVVDIAKSRHFTYLASCQPNADVVLGDARLTLAKEKDESFDVLIVDAFSSDAIPMHLITAEALRLYAQKLAPDGVGVLHVSNRYLDLEAVLAATLKQVPELRAFAIDDPSRSDGYRVTPSSVVFIGKDQRTLHQFLRMRGARTLNWSDLKPWTDDSSDIIGPFRVRLKRHG